MYNAEKYIGNCLDSLLNQGFLAGEYEIIIINDGSTDKSEQIVLGYITEYSQILLFSQKNGGQSKARNKGLSLARGEYVCFVDSDDFLVENSLARIVEEASSRELQILIYQTAERNKINHFPFFVEETQTGIEFIANHNFANYVWNCVISKKFLIDNNLKFVEGRYCEDIMFNLSAFLRADKMASCNANVYCYIIRPDSTMTKSDSVHLLKMIDDFQYVIDYINSLIVEYKSDMTVNCYNRCVSRRDSFTYFLFMRMLKAKMNKKSINQVISKLKNKRLYPYKIMLKDEYRGFKFSISYYITNHPVLYKMACAVYKIVK